MDYINSPLLITGIPRSGTSMVTGIIAACGAFGGETSPSSTSNKKGFFENSRIRKDIVKPYIGSGGWDPMCQRPLPDIYKVKLHSKDMAFINKFKNSVVGVIKSEGYQDGIWYYKDPKMGLMWPIWDVSFPNASWVLIRRDVEDIVRSCLRTSFMKAYKDRSGWLGWCATHERRFEEMCEAKLKIYEIWPQRIINGDLSAIKMLINNLGLTWNEKAVMDFVEPRLWNKGQSRPGKSG
jgi:hypothetical protein